MNSFLYIRCGLKRLNKYYQNFPITKDLIQKCHTNIYNIKIEPSGSEEYTFDDVLNMWPKAGIFV